MAETVIGPNIQIEGDIVGADALTVHGTVRGGRIQVKEGVVIQASGRIEGEVESAAVEIAGVVQGNVAATDKVEIKSGGKLFGDVKAPRILIADGASFKGNINMGG
jgi:cytoskeletal protein CcmA (bactofilin family)